MKNNIIIAILALLLTSFWSISAEAIPLTDIVLFDADGAWDSVTGEDNLGNLNLYGNDGYGWGNVNYLSSPRWNNGEKEYDYVHWNHLFTFDPPMKEILHAKLTVYVRENDCEREYGWLWTEQYAYGNDHWKDLGEVDSGGYRFSINTGWLYDGEFEGKIYGAGGDFKLKKAVLQLCYDPVPAPVPEPVTILLLGSGLIGLGVTKKRKKS